MATQIRINPNALRAAASRQREISEMVYEVRATLRAQAMRLDAAWDSSAGSRAVSALMSGANAVTQIGEAISENAEKLASIADLFEKADAGTRPLQLSREVLQAVAKLAGNAGFVPSLDADFRSGLSVETFELRRVASRCEDAADKLWDLSRNLESMVNSLEADWEGRAFTRFAQDSQVMADALRKCANALRTTAERIVYAAYRYEEMDEDLS